MGDSLISTAAQNEASEEHQVISIAVGQVVNNVDLTGNGLVEVRLSGLVSTRKARVAVLVAGHKQGTYFIPQNGDEVLVAFNEQDVNEAYIIGSLWNGKDLQPASTPTDARTKRIIRTPVGHEIVFDDEAKSIAITSSNKHKIVISPSKIELSTAGCTGSLTLEKSGRVTIESKQGIELKAPTINIQGTNVDIGGSSSARIDGGGYCSIQAGTVRIN